MTRKKRLLILLIFSGVFLASFSIGVEIPISDEEAMAFAEEFNQAIEGIDAVGIFLHNMLIALPMFIPGAGMVWGAFVAEQTGQAFNALVITYPTLSTIPPLSLLLISPFGLMELVAYSIGMSRSFLLIQTIIKKNPIKQDIRPTAIEISIAVALLIGGGLIEYAMIQQFGSELNPPQP